MREILLFRSNSHLDSFRSLHQFPGPRIDSHV